MRTRDFNYELPRDRIAQAPTAERDQSRLLIVHRQTQRLAHRQFPDLLAFLHPGDVLVLNDSRVIPARLRGRKGTGASVEVLLVEENRANDWWVMLRPGKRVRPGTRIEFPAPVPGGPAFFATVTGKNAEGHCRLEFEAVENVRAVLDAVGEVPLPPYVERAQGPTAEDRQRYQTVFASAPGSVAAPTAGLHFTDALLQRLREAGIEIRHLTLHVGLGTFAPVKAALLADHVMHEEAFCLSASTAAALTQARRQGRRVIAVGTTTLRVLETVARENKGGLVPTTGRTRLFVHPPFRFQVVDALLTNFHLPESTLLMLVSAFAAPGEVRGRELILAAYAEAVRQRYRFFSFGDAMLIL